VPPTLAAISERIGAAAAVKAVGGASVHTDGISTVSTVLWESRADVDDRAGSEGDGKAEAAGGAAATVWKEIGSDGYEGSSKEALEEFEARSDGGFEATGPEEAEGGDDVWRADAITAAAPAEMAGAANFPGGADSVGASAGANASGAVMAPEVGQTWTDVGGSDRQEICVVGGDQEKADREELASGGTKTMGAEMIDTEVPISEVAPRPDPGRQYVGRAGGVLQVRDDGGGSRATTTEAGGGVDDTRTGLGDADSGGASLAAAAEFFSKLTGSESEGSVSGARRGTPLPAYG
jgi:hypothetical protein